MPEVLLVKDYCRVPNVVGFRRSLNFLSARVFDFYYGESLPSHSEVLLYLAGPQFIIDHFLFWKKQIEDNKTLILKSGCYFLAGYNFSPKEDSVVCLTSVEHNDLLLEQRSTF